MCYQTTRHPKTSCMEISPRPEFANGETENQRHNEEYLQKSEDLENLAEFTVFQLIPVKPIPITGKGDQRKDRKISIIYATSNTEFTCSPPFPLPLPLPLRYAVFSL